jgi:hypothetical protein
MNMDAGGIVIILMITAAYAIPVVAAGWLLWTTYRIAHGVEAITHRLAVIERSLSSDDKLPD